MACQAASCWSEARNPIRCYHSQNFPKRQGFDGAKQNVLPGFSSSAGEARDAKSSLHGFSVWEQGPVSPKERCPRINVNSRNLHPSACGFDSSEEPLSHPPPCLPPLPQEGQLPFWTPVWSQRSHSNCPQATKYFHWCRSPSTWPGTRERLNEKGNTLAIAVVEDVLHLVYF